MRRLRLIALALTVPLGAAAVADAAVYRPASVLRDDLERVAPNTYVPIRLPASLNLDYDGRVYSDGVHNAYGYEFGIDAARECGAAAACFLAGFSADQGGRFAFRRRVRLAGGRIGRYKPMRCGASCSPPKIEWKQGNGVLYRIQAKLAVSGRIRQRRAMVRAANSAIRSTPR